MPQKPAQCLGCPLWDARGPVWADGPVDAATVYVAEAPGLDECAQGKPFVGKAGWTLDVAMKGAGVDRSDVRIAFVVKCMPYAGRDRSKARKPSRREMQFCGSRYLDAELAATNPNVTVAFGGIAKEYLTKGTLKGDVTVWRGKVVDVE